MNGEGCQVEDVDGYVYITQLIFKTSVSYKYEYFTYKILYIFCPHRVGFLVRR